MLPKPRLVCLTAYLGGLQACRKDSLFYDNFTWCFSFPPHLLAFCFFLFLFCPISLFLSSSFLFLFLVQLTSLFLFCFVPVFSWWQTAISGECCKWVFPLPVDTVANIKNHEAIVASGVDCRFLDNYCTSLVRGALHTDPWHCRIVRLLVRI